MVENSSTTTSKNSSYQPILNDATFDSDEQNDALHLPIQVYPPSP